MDLAQGVGHLAEPLRLWRAQDRAAEPVALLDAAQRARQADAAVLGLPALPAALVFGRDLIEPGGDRVGDGLHPVIGAARRERPGDGGLLEDGAGVVGREGRDQRLGPAGVADDAHEVLADDLLARVEAQRRLLGSLLDEVVLEVGLVLQVDLGLAAGDLVEGRLRDEEMAVVDQIRHVPVEECQQQGADVGAVDVGVGHDDDPAVAQLGDVELVAPDPGAERHDEVSDLLIRDHAVEPGPLDVEDLAPQRQHRLGAPVAPGLGGAAGAVAFDEEEFGDRGVLLGAVLELSGKEVHVHRGLAAGEFAGLAGGLARKRGLDDLADHGLGFARILLEPLGEPLADQAFDRRADLGADQLVLGLAGEFRIRGLDGEDAGQPLAGVVAGEGDLLPLGDAAFLGVFLDRPRQGALEAREMGAAVALRDVVGEGQHVLVVAVVPPHRHIDADAVALAGDADRLRDQRGAAAVEILDELLHAALEVEGCLSGGLRPLVAQHDADAGVEEGEFAQPLLQGLEGVVEIREGLGRGEEAHLGSVEILGLADNLERLDGLAALEAGAVQLAVAPDAQLEPVRERVDDRDADAVQPAGHLVGVAVELPARMQLGHDDLGRRDALLMDLHRDAPAVVGHRHRGVLVDADADAVGMAREGLVDAVVDDFVDHVVQARAVVRVPDVHARALSHSLEALEDLDGVGAVAVG